MGEQSELTLKRRAEIKRMRLYLWLGAIGFLIGFACMWSAGKATEAVLPETIALLITLLWCAALLSWQAFNFFLNKWALMTSYHATEDAIATADHLRDSLEKAIDLLKQADREREEVRTILDPLIGDLQEQYDQAMAKKSGGDWQPKDQAEIDRVLAQAEREAAKIEAATGRKATEKEIAQAINMSDRHYRRYKKADTSGHK